MKVHKKFIVTYAKLAEYLGVSEVHIRRLVSRKRFSFDDYKSVFDFVVKRKMVQILRTLISEK